MTTKEASYENRRTLMQKNIPKFGFDLNIIMSLISMYPNKSCLFLPIAVGDGLAIDAVSVSVVIIGELKSPLSLPSSPSY